jgi:hypothetical protein
MGFYDEMQAFASEALAEFRQGAVVLTKTTYYPGPDQPWEPGVPVTDTYPLDAVVKAVEDKYVDGTTILATDRQVMCAVLPVEIEPGDGLTIDDVAVTIVKTMRIPAAGTAVAWKLIVRG